MSIRLQFNEALTPPPPAIILQQCTPQNAAASQSPGRFRPHPANPRFIVVSLRSTSRRTLEMDRSVTNWLGFPPPLSVKYSPLFPSPQTGPPFHPLTNSPNIKRPPTVDCGMVDILDRVRRSNFVLPTRFGQGNKPPRWPNFAQNMHPNKRRRHSLARPNWTTPEYHDVDHGLAVGWPRRFCVIAPIAFVGGMGGWCRGALN